MGSSEQQFIDTMTVVKRIEQGIRIGKFPRPPRKRLQKEKKGGRLY